MYWDFGDGNTSWEEEPFHIFEDFGVYNVCLEVHYDDSCIATICHDIHNLYYEVNEQFKLKCGTTLSLDKVEKLTAEPAYPNPARKNITIPVDAGLEQAVQVQIINVLGEQTVYTDNYSLQEGSNALKIKVENL
ncbi:MAG: PKD domain-containing protein [Bacteroidales bacterium]|nr:PKD domain-containing protein [Bacteroidales bacterium]